MPRFQTGRRVTVASGPSLVQTTRIFVIKKKDILKLISKPKGNCKIHNIIPMPICKQGPEATVTLVPVWKRGILKSLVSHFLNFKSWIQLIYDTVDTYM